MFAPNCGFVRAGGFSHSLCGLGAHQPSPGLELRTESRRAPDRPLLPEGLQVGRRMAPPSPAFQGLGGVRSSRFLFF